MPLSFRERKSKKQLQGEGVEGIKLGRKNYVKYNAYNEIINKGKNGMNNNEWNNEWNEMNNGMNEYRNRCIDFLDQGISVGGIRQEGRHKGKKWQSGKNVKRNEKFLLQKQEIGEKGARARKSKQKGPPTKSQN